MANPRHFDIPEYRAVDEPAALSAEAILAQRELGRRRLLPFILNFEPQYQAGWVHKDICARLEKFEQDVVARRSPRLLLSMPPRHGKSMIASQYLPAWFLGRNPKMEVIATSYSSSLATRFSRSVRALFRDPDFDFIFPESKIDPYSQGLEHWNLEVGGGYACAGVGGGITGKGAHMLIIDDPVKSAEDAESENYLDVLWDWFTSVAYTRLAPGGGIICIQTRWVQDDLAGRLERLSEEGAGDLYENVKYPAIALHDEQFRKEGQALHPDRYPLEALVQIRQAVGPRVWRALYQQAPTHDVGSYFKREWLRFYEQAPQLQDMTVYTAWDLAIGQRQHNDWTVGMAIGLCRQGNIWVLDMVRGRWNSMDIVEEIINLYVAHKPVLNLIERGQIDMAIGPYLEKRRMERKEYGLAIKSLPVGRRDKAARARGIQGRFQQGKVYIPKAKPWTDVLVNELMSFPNGRNDDCVDVLAWLGLYLVEMAPPAEMMPSKTPSWKDKLKQFVHHSEDGVSHMSA